jgi:hypothetical protein
MIRKIILRVLVAAIVLDLFVIAPLPVHAQSEVLNWEPVAGPGKTGLLVVNPVEISELAVGSGTFYAIDIPNSTVYRSETSGSSWEDITRSLAVAGAVLPATKISVAPDDSSFVAVVTNGGTQVFTSADGGDNWATLGIIIGLVGTIQTIDISPNYTVSNRTTREVAVGTATWGNSTTDGQVWTRSMAGVGQPWVNQNIQIDSAVKNAEVASLAYSARFATDYTLVAIAATNSDVAVDYRNQTWLAVLNRETRVWNNITGYPVAITSTGDSPAVNYIHASLALPSGYNVTRAATRQVFVSLDRAPNGADDVYWVNDTQVRRLNVNGGSAIDINSIAFSGTTTSGVLLAGDVNPVPGTLSVSVRRTDWVQSSPSIVWQTAAIPPTGPGNAYIAWSANGTTAYCGTGQGRAEVLYDESAFSVSTDRGNKWQQSALMNTALKPGDIAPAPDSKSLFVASSTDTGPEAVWRTAGDVLGKIWARVLTLDTDSDAVILRMSPAYLQDSTMYAVEVNGGNRVAFTHDRGNSWKQQICTLLAGETIIDMAVKDASTVFVALPGGNIRKSLNSALTWQEPVNTKVRDINMISLIGDNMILVGGRDGDVAYSLDGGQNFTRIPQTVGGGSGDAQVAADVDYNSNHIIYAAGSYPNQGLWRWVIGVSSAWERMDAATTFIKGWPISGLVTGTEGTLYATGLNNSPVTTGERDSYRIIQIAADPAADSGMITITSGSVEFSTIGNARVTDLDDNTITVLNAPGAAKWTTSDINDSILVEATGVPARGTWTAASHGVVTAAGIGIDADGDARIGNLSGVNQIAQWYLGDVPAISVTNSDVGGIRTLNPARVNADGIELDCLTAGLTGDSAFDTATIYSHMLPALKISGNTTQNDLWAVDSVNWTIYRFQDTLCKAGPVQQLPLNGDIVSIDAFSNVKDLTLVWKQVTGATAYEVDIYSNSNATGCLWTGTSNTTSITATSGGNPARLPTGVIYYWRVRALRPILSPWSSTRSLVPALGAAQWDPFVDPERVLPIPGSYETPIRPTFVWNPADWATGYDFKLSKSADFSNSIYDFTGAEALKITAFTVDKDLDYGTDYYWSVTAISSSSRSNTAYGSFRTLTRVITPAETIAVAAPTPNIVQAPVQNEDLPWIVGGVVFSVFLVIIIFTVLTRRRYS